MKAILAVGAGGALGAMARYLVLILATRLFGLNFPYGTIIVNIAGSLMLGVLIEALALRWNVTAELRLFLVVGFLSAFTTFSAFSMDFALLYERGRLDLCALYATVSVALSVGALFFGMIASRSVFMPRM
ncbi:MAG: fluoride efflux transporter CrcB [Rhodospirillales bacterium]|jgi:CrcB protein|nr:fluoride efflux transporter CrcB [Rhodospirillales bacterium]HJO73443.1 fluoride efflux transporter CrcB [Rhodospirillales bacterium]